ARFAIATTSTHYFDGAWQTNDAEMDKILGTIFIEGYTHALFDNATGKVDCHFFDAALTSEDRSTRVLGLSKIVTLPNQQTWFLTANNAEFGSDLPSRCALVRLDSGLESPEDRDGFAIPDLLAWTSEHRAGIV